MLAQMRGRLYHRQARQQHCFQKNLQPQIEQVMSNLAEGSAAKTTAVLSSASNRAGYVKLS